MKSKKTQKKTKINKVIAVAGGFDPLHIGHIRHFKEAKKLGDKLVVILAPDLHMKIKKGRAFMPFIERKEVLEAIGYVDEVIMSIDQDGTVTETLRNLKPHVFAKGGDRIQGNMPQSELDVCEGEGIEIIYNVGGEKIQSSSNLTGLYKKN